MNEFDNNAVTPEEDDWSDISFDDLVDEGTNGETETETAEADQQNAESVEAETGEVNAEANEGGEADQTFNLKYLGEEKAVNREEVIALAQQGMDYQRIRTKYEEAEQALAATNEKLKNYDADMEILGLFKQAAQEQRMGVDEFAMHSMAAVMAAKNGTTIEHELPKAQLAFDKQKFEKQKSEWEKSKANPTQNDAEKQIKREVEEFRQAFPDIASDANKIPKEIWEAKNAEPGKTLTQHYREYISKQKDVEIANLKAQLEQAQQSAKNNQRSTGSQSSNSSSSEDIWEQAWRDN